MLVRKRIRPRRKGIGKAALGGIDHYTSGQTVPVRCLPDHAHAIFPCLLIQMLLANDHSQLVVGPGVHRFQYFLYLLAQFHIADKPAGFHDRLHHPKRECAKRPKLDAGGGLAGSFGLNCRETSDDVPALLRPVDPKDAETICIKEIQMRKAVLLAQRL